MSPGMLPEKMGRNSGVAGVFERAGTVRMDFFPQSGRKKEGDFGGQWRFCAQIRAKMRLRRAARET